MVMSQNLFLGAFKCLEQACQFNEDFIKSNREDSDIEYFIKVDVQYLEKLHILHNKLSFLPERMKNIKMTLVTKSFGGNSSKKTSEKKVLEIFSKLWSIISVKI